MTCGWNISYSRCTGDADTALLSNIDAAVKLEAEEMATDLLYAWTGRVFGVCEVSVRPERRDMSCGCPAPPSHLPVYHAVAQSFATMGACVCGGASSFKLPGPVREIVSVTINGVVEPPSRYNLTADGCLERLNGLVWPDYQDQLLTGQVDGWWEVTYTRGIPVPTGGQVAAGVLALEIMRYLCDDPACQLPRRVKSISRQGISMEMVEQGGFDEDTSDGKTGLWLVDSWVDSVMKPKRRPRVISPDFRSDRQAGAWHIR